MSKPIVALALAIAGTAAANPALPDRNTLVPRLGLAPADGSIARELQAADDFRKQLIQIAVSRHPGLAGDVAKETAADAGLAAARSIYHPTIALNAGTSRSVASDLDTEQSRTTTSRSVGLSLRENLWHGGQDALDIDIATDERQIVRLTREQHEAQIRYDVERALLSYNQAAMEEGLALASSADAETLRRISERKFAAGQVGKIDVHAATMRESEARASVVTARLRKSSAWYAVLRAMGGAALSGESLPREDEAAALARVALPFPAAAPTLTPAEKPGFAAESALLSSSKAEKLLTKSYRSRFLPTVDFVASVGRSADRIEDAESNDTSTRLGIELSWPLWERPRDHAIVRAAAEVDIAKARVDEARRGAALVAEELSRRVTELYAALPPYADAYAQAEKLYDAQVKLYDAGAVELAQVTQADGTKASALRNWYDASQEIRVALARWQALEAGLVVSGGDQAP